MENALIPVRENPNMDDAAWNELTKSQGFLPRLQVFGSNSKPVKMGKFPVGHLGMVLGTDRFQDLGTEVDCLVIQVRPKAMSVNGDKVVSAFNHKSNDFKQIVSESADRDSGCMYGPEFLLWLPTAGRFVTFFMCNQTLRQEAPLLRQLLGHPATIKIRFIPSKKFGGWHGVECFECSTPFDLPSSEDIDNQVNEFLSPKDLEVEEVEDEDTTGRDV